MTKTFTEKRFFEWREDDVSVTLRASSGSYGGAARQSSFALCGNGRGIVQRRRKRPRRAIRRARETRHRGDNVIDVEVFAVDMGGGKTQCGIYEDMAPTLSCTHAGEPVVCYQEEKDVEILERTRDSRNAFGEKCRGGSTYA